MLAFWVLNSEGVGDCFSLNSGPMRSRISSTGKPVANWLPWGCVPTFFWTLRPLNSCTAMRPFYPLAISTGL